MSTPDITKTTVTVTSHPAPGASTVPHFEGQDAWVILVSNPDPADNPRPRTAPADLSVMVVPAADHVEYTYPTASVQDETVFVTVTRTTDLPPAVRELLTLPQVQDALAAALDSPTAATP